jgi:oxalate decarboxylase
MFSRRDMLAVSAAGMMTATAARSASFGNPDQPPQCAINAKGPGNLTDPGPQNPALGQQFPSAQFPPATDVGGMPLDWASFNNAPKRIQNGGWARQVTQADFQISETISGVNMRLTAGGIRELHWHQAAEWAVMTYGSCRVTVLDAEGRPYIADVQAGDLWYFPAGLPHHEAGHTTAPDHMPERDRKNCLHLAGRPHTLIPRTPGLEAGSAFRPKQAFSALLCHDQTRNRNCQI